MKSVILGIILTTLLSGFSPIVESQTESVCFLKDQFKSDENIFTPSVADIKAAAFCGDSDIDIVSIDSGEIALWLNQGGRLIPGDVLISDLHWGARLAVADFDGDLDVDIVFTEEGAPGISTGSVKLLENDGLGNFSLDVIDPEFIGAVSVSAADMDRDGDMDIVVSSRYPWGIVWCDLIWFENLGGLQFTGHLIDTILQGANDTDVADLDHDGDFDIFFSPDNGFEFSWYENNGHQEFTRHFIETDYEEINYAELVDLNQNGSIDIVLVTDASDDLVWLENDGSQNFTWNIISTEMRVPKRTTSTDLDQDGDIDIINAFYSETNDFVWWENDGQENFTLRVIEPWFNQTISHCVADINNDGRMDVVGGNGWGGLAWWENQAHIGVDLFMPAHHYHPGDACFLDGTIFNYSQDTLDDLPMCIILAAAGNYWFYPGWSEDIQFQNVSVAPGFQELSILDPFNWPVDAGTGSGVNFYSLFLKPDLSNIYGVLNVWDISWSE